MDLKPDWDIPLRTLHHGAEIREIILAALAAVEPGRAVRRALVAENLPFVDKSSGEESTAPLYLLAVGKAAVPMAEAAIKLLGNQIKAGIIITKTNPGGGRLDDRFQVMQADHPVPGEASLRAGQTIEDLIQRMELGVNCLALISGGASALMTLPVESISLADLQKTTRLLLSSGADINEMNCIRKHLDRIKGGGLARMLNGRRCLALILSDVMGDDLSTIGSGPLSADESTYPDALGIFGKYQLVEQLPVKVRQVLLDGVNGKRIETVKPGDPLLGKITCRIIANNHSAVTAACAQARRMDWQTKELGLELRGEARLTGEWLAKKLRETDPGKKPVCFIVGGETTVTLHGSGRGGRNLETALEAVQVLDGVKDEVLITLATDGDDGNSGAAGAVVTGDTYRLGLQSGYDPAVFLDNNDSMTYFEKQKSLLVTGPTGTNVNDLVILIRG